MKTIDYEAKVADSCRHCGSPIEVYKWVVECEEEGLNGLGTTSCEACIEKYTIDQHLRVINVRWENVIPKRYRKTDRKDSRFPKSHWKQLRTNDVKRNLIIYGPDGIGKTRLAVEWLKLVVWRNHYSFDFLPAEDINGMFDTRENEVELKRFQSPDVLLIRGLFDELDNDQRSTKWVKRLLMHRKRNNKITLATSYITSRAFTKLGKDYWATDRERLHNIVSGWQHETLGAPNTGGDGLPLEEEDTGF